MDLTQTSIHEAVAAIRRKIPADFVPQLGMVLGSGSGNIAQTIDPLVELSYQELPGFPVPTVAGHAGRLIIGHLKQVPVVCYQGRAHYYEGAQSSHCYTMIRTLKLLGAKILLVTNAVGSMRSDFAPGSLVAISDHINFQGINPLVGINADEFGPRFPPMADAYDPELRSQLHAIAQANHIELHEGIYIGVLGPSFETPAEIRAFRTWGADLVGMSTVPEVIVARHCGLRVAGISTVTNYASGLSKEVLTHELTLEYATMAIERLRTLITEFVSKQK